MPNEVLWNKWCAIQLVFGFNGSKVSMRCSRPCSWKGKEGRKCHFRQLYQESSQEKSFSNHRKGITSFTALITREESLIDERPASFATLNDIEWRINVVTQEMFGSKREKREKKRGKTTAVMLLFLKEHIEWIGHVFLSIKLRFRPLEGLDKELNG